MIDILVIDDHPLISGGISVMLQDMPGINLTGSATTGCDGLQAIKSHTYDIVLVDISLPDMDGLQLCSEIRKISADIKILGLTSSNETGIITQFLQRGGNGYLLKNMDREELLLSIAEVMQGKIYLSKAANEKILQQFHSVSQATLQAPVLTRREKEILEQLNEGLTGPQIAARLFISPYTVETHRKNLMQKFNAPNLQTLLKLGRENKLIK